MGGKKVGKKLCCGSIFCFFEGWWPVPSFWNSPFHCYLSNGPYPVPHFALQPQFRLIFRILNFGKSRYYCNNKRRYDLPLVFRFSFFWGFPGSGTAPGGFYGKFQYRTTRFCGVSWPPCPENLVRKIFCSMFGEFQGEVFPVPKRHLLVKVVKKLRYYW